MSLARIAIFMLLWTSGLLMAQPSPEADDSTRDAFKQGIKAFNQKQFDVAAEAFTKVPELGGFLSLYKHWYLGQAYLELGNYPQAEPEFAKIIQGKPSSELKFQSQFLLAEAALRQQKYALGLERLQPLEKKWRHSYRYPEVLYRMMVADLKLGHTASMCKRVRKLYTAYPASPLVIGWGSDISKVEIDGKKLPCKLEREDFSARLRSLQWAGESGKAHQEIVEKMNKAVDGDRLQLEMTLANFLVNEGSVDDALNLLIRYYPTQKSNLGYLMLLGKAAARSGEYQTSVGAFERAYTLSPHSRKGREALYQAAYLSYQFQDYDGAVRKFEQFAKANPKSGLAKDAQWHLAWLQYLRNDFKGALNRFEVVKKSLKSKRKKADVLEERLLYWTAMSHVRLSHFDDARTNFEAIIARNPYSYYGLAAQARLETIPAKKEAVKPRVPASSAKAAPVDGPSASSPADEEKESEEDLVDNGDEAVTTADGADGEEEGIQPSDFKDPVLRARIDVALQLIQLGLNDIARWELWEVERHTSNVQYLKQLISAYEKIGSFNRSATIAELSFGKEREAQGMENSRVLWQATYPQAFKTAVLKFTKEFNVPPEWTWAIMRTESMYRPDVISPVGAKGLMQLMPYTARNLNRLRGVTSDEVPNLIDPDTNIRLGSQYLARLQDKFKGNLVLAAASYNAGPHRVEGWLVNFGNLETDEFIEHIPFLETRNYVKKVLRNYTFYRRLYAKDLKSVEILAHNLGVPIPTKAATRESWDSI